MESSSFLSYSFLSHMAGVAVRSLGLAAVAAMAMLLFRVKSAAARHAVWTVVAAGMLVLAAFEPLMPRLPVAVLRASPAPVRQFVPPSLEWPVPSAPQPVRTAAAPK